jgi:hypothetical protein
MCLRLLEGGHATRPGSLPFSCDRPNPRSRRQHRSAQSSSSSMVEANVVHRRPLYVRQCQAGRIGGMLLSTYVQRIPRMRLMTALLQARYIRRTHWRWTNVLILKPSVGLILLMSSLFSFFSTVVLPALSRPLRRCHSLWSPTMPCASSQEENAHLLGLTPVLADNREQAHCRQTMKRWMRG